MSLILLIVIIQYQKQKKVPEKSQDMRYAVQTDESDLFINHKE